MVDAEWIWDEKGFVNEADALNFKTFLCPLSWAHIETTQKSIRIRMSFRVTR